MTPITLTKPSTFTPGLTIPADKLAIQALEYTAERRCKNKEVLGAIVNALGDKNYPDQYLAVIFKNAHQYHYVAQLNQLIEHINSRYGPGSVTISEHVCELLAYGGIELVQHDDGTVQMSRSTPIRSYSERHVVIKNSTAVFFPGDIAGLICAFDDEIEISDSNSEEILTILRSGDRSAKRLLLSAAGNQNRIYWLNQQFNQFRSDNQKLDLSRVDLSNLDLTGIELINTDLRQAILENTRLDHAVLKDADLRFANLNGTSLCNAKLIATDLRYAKLRHARLDYSTVADSDMRFANLNRASLSRAELFSTDLSYARLIAAKLTGASLNDIRLTDACFICADLQNAKLVLQPHWNDCSFAFANTDNCSISDAHSVTNLLSSHHSDLIGHACRMVIDEDERAIISTHGISIMPLENGAVELRNAVTVKKDFRRHALINSTLQTMRFSDPLTKLVALYDDDMEIGESNKKLITEIMRSKYQSAKGMLIATASRQGRIPFLNAIFNTLQHEKFELDLSRVDLSNLDLTGIDLTLATLSYARLQNSRLKKALLKDALLIQANLNGTNLSEADLDGADLSHARMIAANLWMTKFRLTRLNGTLLLCANLQTPYLTASLVNSFYQFARIDADMFPGSFTLPRLNTSLNVSIVPDNPDQNSDPCEYDYTRSDTAVITESEKNQMLERGLRFDANDDGTMQLSKPLLLKKDPERDRLIDKTLNGTLPKVLTKIISDYDDELDICPANEAYLLAMLESNNPVAKAQVIAAASHRSQIAALNTVFAKFKTRKPTLDLSRVDLSNLQLEGIVLDGANLSSAIMHGCNLRHACLNRARLDGANLNGASLQGAQMVITDLSKALLIGANLTCALLNGARLTRAVLKFANLTNANLQYGTNLQGAYLDHANLDSTNFTGADLTKASLMHAKMRHTQLDEANLSHARLVHANLLYASLRSVNLTRADFSEATLDRVTLMTNPILTGTIWTGTSFHAIAADGPTKKQMPLRMWMHCK